MKTIRSNCFETNSSSTHSITLHSKSKSKKKYKELVIDGVLYPGNLLHTSAYSEFSRSSEASIVKASTPAEKLSLYFHYLKAAEVDLKYNDDEWPDAANLLPVSLELTKQYSGLEVDMNFTDQFQYYSDSRSFFDTILRSQNVRKEIEKFFNDVVLNDDIEIIDESESY